MSPGEFASSIRRSWELTSQLELGRSFSMAVSLGVDAEFRDLFFEKDALYEEIYLLGLKKSHYNFILNDFSYFQFSLVEESVRYAVFPNPFDYQSGGASSDELDILVEEGLLTFEEYADLVSDSPVKVGVPPFRYEFAPDQYREILHPCSHFHIGHHSEDRWPIERKLTPLAFTMLIMRNYHPLEWAKFEDAEHDFVNPLNGEIRNEKRKCSRLTGDLFTEKEKLLFYFT